MTEVKNAEKYSLLNKHWKLKQDNERVAVALAQRYNIIDIIARIIASREINLDDIDTFLDPKLRTLLPDPYHLLDMEKAAARAAEAILQKQRIGVFGDYDVDGATSSALLTRFFKFLDIDVEIYIPDRIKEGYGPSKGAFEYLKKKDIDLVITVDCGTLSVEPIKFAKSIGIDVVVIDHHLNHNILPDDAVAVVNPNRTDETTEIKYLAAVGVSFFFATAIYKKLKEIGMDTSVLDKVNLLSLLDLVALGTVCDVVPLVKINRAFVKHGIKILSKRLNAGLAALCDVAKLQNAPTPYDLGFVLGPRINAGGRVGESYLGAKILTLDNYDEAYKIAERLENYNIERKAIESIIIEQAVEQADAQNMRGEAIIIVHGDNWHQGVIGIIASKIKERYDKPAVVIAFDGDYGKASCRGVQGVDLGSLIASAKAAGLLLDGGGHVMAAGFTILKPKLNDFIAYIRHAISDYSSDIFRVDKYFDSYLALSAVDSNLHSHLNMVGPFGMQNPEPIFYIEGVRVVYSNLINQSHVYCSLKDPYDDTKQVRARAFKVAGTPLADALSQDNVLDIVGYLRMNNWNNNSYPEIIILDAVAR